MDKAVRILITGATGFIGKFLAEELLARGYVNLTAMARRSSDTGFLKNNGIKIVLADITEKVTLDAIPAAYDIVFHCAASLGGSRKNTLEKVNIGGTENICRWAAVRRVRKFIYVSSVAVNSGNIEVPLTEDAPYNAATPYGYSKIEAEKIAIRFRNAGLPMVIIRPCMVYGEGEPHIMRFLALLVRLRLFFAPNCGKAKWHLVSVRNVAACLVRCMEDDRALGGIFNIADGDILTTREVIRIMAENLAAPEPFVFSPFFTRLFTLLPVVGKRVGFLCKDRVYSIERLKSVLNFYPPYQAVRELARAASSFR